LTAAEVVLLVDCYNIKTSLNVVKFWENGWLWLLLWNSRNR